MKTSGQGIVVLAFAMLAAFVMQGCAGTGNVKYEAGAAPGASAETSGGSPKLIVNADTKENFEAVVAGIHKQMEPGGRWQFVDKGQRSTIDARFSDMRSLFDKYDSVAAMDQANRLRMLDDQQAINAILAKDDGNRVICKSDLPVGSHIPVTTCHTLAEIKFQQEKSQKSMRDFQTLQGQMNEATFMANPKISH